jgi:hypothetical protein
MFLIIPCPRSCMSYCGFSSPMAPLVAHDGSNTLFGTEQALYYTYLIFWLLIDSLSNEVASTGPTPLTKDAQGPILTYIDITGSVSIFYLDWSISYTAEQVPY